MSAKTHVPPLPTHHTERESGFWTDTSNDDVEIFSSDEVGFSINFLVRRLFFIHLLVFFQVSTFASNSIWAPLYIWLPEVLRSHQPQVVFSSKVFFDFFFIKIRHK